MIKKKIFTFWEPKENIPAYLKLCMETWKKFLPEYEIIILDYSNLNDYIGKNYFDKYLYKKFPIVKQADAIRCAILKKYGGIWFDLDTIITSGKFREFLEIKSDFILIGNHIAFIKANSNSYILEKWSEEIPERIKTYKKDKLWAKYFNNRYYKELKKWDYLGNGIIDKYLNRVGEKDYYSINRIESGALAELSYYKYKHADSKKDEDLYRKFWFENNLSDYLKEYKNEGIILLHNSWTPEKYKEMTKEEFLSTNGTLSEFLNDILYVHN